MSSVENRAAMNVAEVSSRRLSVQDPETAIHITERPVSVRERIALIRERLSVSKDQLSSDQGLAIRFNQQTGPLFSNRWNQIYQQWQQAPR